VGLRRKSAVFGGELLTFAFGEQAFCLATLAFTIEKFMGVWAHPVTSKFCQIDPPCDGYLHLETAAKPLTSLGRL